MIVIIDVVRCKPTNSLLFSVCPIYSVVLCKKISWLLLDWAILFYLFYYSTFFVSVSLLASFWFILLVALGFTICFFNLISVYFQVVLNDFMSKWTFLPSILCAFIIYLFLCMCEGHTYLFFSQCLLIRQLRGKSF